MIQGALGLSLKEDYNASLPGKTEKQASYKKLIKNLWANFDDTSDDAALDAIVDNVFAFEDCTAAVSLSGYCTIRNC